MDIGQLLAASGTLLLDGGTGSELRQRGVSLSGSSWSAAANLDRRELLTQIHCDYLAAGADIVTANTFATTRFVLAGAGLEDEFEAINTAAVAAARAAVARSSRPACVAASISCLPPRFDRTQYPDRASEYAAYAELAELVAEQGVDLIVLEMLQDPVHAELACRAADAVGLPFWAGISCRLDPAGAGPHPDAQPRAGARLVGFDEPSIEFAAVLDCVLAHEPDAIAIMHSPLAAMLPALAQVCERWAGPVAAYAELDYADDPDSRNGPQVSPASYAAAAAHGLGAGARIIGGCCGTGPAHIAALRRLIDD